MYLLAKEYLEYINNNISNIMIIISYYYFFIYIYFKLTPLGCFLISYSFFSSFVIT